jgi:hypothetical protein
MDWLNLLRELCGDDTLEATTTRETTRELDLIACGEVEQEAVN